MKKHINTMSKVFVGGQVLDCRRAEFSVSEESNDCTKESDGWSNLPLNQSWEIKADPINIGAVNQLEDLLGKTSNEVVAMIIKKPGKMPRKMKKAYRTCSRRNTKWARKAANYLRRYIYYVQHAELVVTDEMFGSMSAVLKFDKIEDGGDSVVISGKSMRDVLMKFKTP